MVDSRKPNRRQFIQEFKFAGSNLLSIPLNKYKSYSLTKDYVVLGIDYCRTQYNQTFNVVDLIFTDSSGKGVLPIVPLVEKIDYVSVFLGDNVNIDTGIISLIGDDTPNKLLFETKQINEQENNSGNPELFGWYWYNNSHSQQMENRFYRCWSQLEHQLQSNLNQNLDGIKEADLDLKDNEVLLKVQQTERLELKVQADCSNISTGVHFGSHKDEVNIFSEKSNLDYSKNTMNYGSPFVISAEASYPDTQQTFPFFQPAHRNVDLGVYIRTPF